MRIELRSNAVSSFVNQINNIESSISETIDILKKQRNNIDSINGGHNNATRNASNNLAYRINKEIDKKNRAALIAKQTNAFINDTIAIDKDVANTVKTNQKQFYKQYSWLKPQSPVSGVLEDCKKWLKDTWKTVKEKLAKVWESIRDWVVNNYKILIGTIGLIVAVALAVFAAPTTLAGVLGAIFKVLGSFLISVACSFAFTAILAILKKQDVWEEIKNSADDTYMEKGIFAAIGVSTGISIFSIIRNVVSTIRNIRFGKIKKISFEGVKAGIDGETDETLIRYISVREINKKSGLGYYMV